MNPAGIQGWVAAHHAAVIGGGVAGVGGIALYARHKAAATATTAATSATLGAATPTATGSGVYDSSDVDTYNELEGQIGVLAGQVQTIGAATPKLVTGPTGAKGATGATGKTGPVAVTTKTAAAPVVDKYTLGEIVNAQSGEKITGIAEDTADNGFYNLTSAGGIYTSGAATTKGLGSFLGYAATMPKTGANSATNQIAQHGTFSGGKSGIVATPTGYTETNAAGEHYSFG